MKLHHMALRYAKENKTELTRFAIIGASGFIVNFVGLWLLHGLLKVNLVVAQLVATEAAILSNFSFHHNWTFKEFHSESLKIRLIKFHLAVSVGVLISSSILWILAGLFGVNYLVGLTLGTGVSMFWNYVLSRHVVWANKINAK